jgi:hypothetical protein
MTRRKTFRRSGSDVTSTESLDFRDLITSASPSEIEAACVYEYFRESAALRETVSKGDFVSSTFFSDLTPAQRVRLIKHLGNAGFPKKAWKHVHGESQKRLILLLAKWKEEQMEGSQGPGEPRRIPPKYPPVVIEPAQFDGLDLPYYWPDDAPEPKVFETTAERKYFKGFIRIDEDYNETEVMNAFQTWFREHYPKTKGGRGPRWSEKLNQLAVMRIWKSEHDQWKRLERGVQETMQTRSGGSANGCQSEGQNQRRTVCRPGLLSNSISRPRTTELLSISHPGTVKTNHFLVPLNFGQLPFGHIGTFL